MSYTRQQNELISFLKKPSNTKQVALSRKVLFSIAILQFFLVSIHMILEARSVYIIVDNNIRNTQAAAAAAVLAVCTCRSHVPLNFR